MIGARSAPQTWALRVSGQFVRWPRSCEGLEILASPVPHSSPELPPIPLGIWRPEGAERKDCKTFQVQLSLEPVTRRKWQLFYPIYRFLDPEWHQRVLLVRADGTQAVQADGSIYRPTQEVEEPFGKFSCPYCHTKLPADPEDYSYGRGGEHEPYEGTLEILTGVAQKGIFQKRASYVGHDPYYGRNFPVIYCKQCSSPFPFGAGYHSRLTMGLLAKNGNRSSLRTYYDALELALSNPAEFCIQPHCQPTPSFVRSTAKQVPLGLWTLSLPHQFPVDVSIHALQPTKQGSISNSKAFRYGRLLVLLVDPFDIPELAEKLGRRPPDHNDHPTTLLAKWIDSYCQDYGMDLSGQFPVSLAVVLLRCRRLAEAGLLSRYAFRAQPWGHREGINRAAAGEISYEISEFLSRHMASQSLCPTVRNLFPNHCYFAIQDLDSPNTFQRIADPMLWQMANLGYLRWAKGIAAQKQIRHLLK